MNKSTKAILTKKDGSKVSTTLSHGLPKGENTEDSITTYVYANPVEGYVLSGVDIKKEKTPSWTY